MTSALEESSPEPVLEVHDLTVRLREGRNRGAALVDGVSYAIAPTAALAIVGETGAGKSIAARAVLGLLDPQRFVVTGGISCCGVAIDRLSPKERRRYITSKAALVLQDPTRSLNPTIRVGWQIAEAMYKGRSAAARGARLSKSQARRESLELMREVGIADPDARFFSYPHQLSGGMRQRIVLAIALSCQPQILFCDEATTALDVTTQAMILDLLDRLRRERHMAMVLITHDLLLASSRAERVLVMNSGRLVECLPADDLFSDARMPYTRDLVLATPGAEQRALPRPLPEAAREDPDPDGCPYYARCSDAGERCRTERPALAELRPGHLCRCWYPRGRPDGGGVDG